MKMANKKSSLSGLQWISIGVSIALFLVLYFGFSTKSPEQKKVEMVRSQNLEATSIMNLLNEAGDRLSEESAAVLHSLEADLRDTDTDSLKVPIYEAMSRFWYQQGEYAIAGHYAEKIAEILQSEQSWSIAGTTHALALQKETEEDKRNYSFQRAVNAFESAISINPGNVQHKLNLALCYTEIPPQDNPMRGIQMLLQLQDENPEYAGVKIALARLAIKTGQYEKALERLTQAREIDPSDKRIPCLLSEVYRMLGNEEEAAKNEFDCLN